MAIDNCSHSFLTIAHDILPARMIEMYDSISNPLPMGQFLAKGDGVKRLLSRYGLNQDFPGCYVLIEDGKPLYVGISRQVFRRLLLHCRGETHYKATLAYTIVAKQMTLKQTRAAHMNDITFFRVLRTGKAANSEVQFCFRSNQRRLSFIPI